MKTPWGEIPILDAHVHYFSKSFFAALAVQKPGVDIPAALGWDAPEDLAARWVAELDRHAVLLKLDGAGGRLAEAGGVEGDGAELAIGVNRGAVEEHRDQFEGPRG